MPKKYRHLPLEDRALIQAQLQLGCKPVAIAAGLHRPRSCISRELARNDWKVSSATRSAGRAPIAGGYSCSRANVRARTLSVVPRVARKLVVGNALWGKVRDGLQQGLSPEQVAGTLARMNHPVRLCHETMYQAIYLMPKGELRTDTIALLRFGHHKRRPRTRGVDRRGQIPNMISMDQRPEKIAQRLVPGHWEGDHIKDQGNRSQIGTLVERTTLYVALVKLDNGTAQATAEGFGAVLSALMTTCAARSRMTKDAKWHRMRNSRKRPASQSTARIRTVPGNAAATKTPMACCVSICPRDLTSLSIHNSSSTTSHGNATPGPENHWTGNAQPSCSFL